MSQEKQPLKPDIVSSIFSRQAKRRLSSLFMHKGAKADLGQTGPGRPGAGSTIKKRFPFGLDIGTDSIKIVQLGYDDKGALKITNLIIEELPKAALANPRENGQLPVEALKRIVAERGLKGDCFTIAPRASVKINLIKLPQMPPNEIDKAVQWEIRQVLQADLKDISLDYIIIEKEKVKFLGLQTGVLAVAIFKKDIFEHLSLLESAGLNPLAIDIEPLADLAAVDYAKKDQLASDNEAVLWLDFGAGKTTLSITCNNELISIRYLNVTGNSLTKTVSAYCQLPWENAEILKKTFGLAASGTEQVAVTPFDKAAQVKNAIFPILENMAQDIDHTFKYFSYQVTKSEVTRFNKLILSGGSSYLKGLVPFLHHRLNADVELVDSLDSFGPLEQFTKEKDLNCRLNVALGLALRGTPLQI